MTAVLTYSNQCSSNTASQKSHNEESGLEVRCRATWDTCFHCQRALPLHGHAASCQCALQEAAQFKPLGPCHPWGKTWIEFCAPG